MPPINHDLNVILESNESLAGVRGKGSFQMVACGQTRINLALGSIDMNMIENNCSTTIKQERGRTTKKWTTSPNTFNLDSHKKMDVSGPSV